MAEKDKKSSASYVPFRPLDSLFEPTVQEKPQAGAISQISIGELFPFKDHPFLPYTEERMEEMVESVKEYGVMSPIIARPRKEGGYEIISGHNRVEACERAGIETVPTLIREMDDDTAIILMVDSNLKQRDKLKPSEKAKAYQMKMDALRRQGRRTDLDEQPTSRQLVGKLKRETANQVGEAAGDSGRQVQRYIRLNSLIPALQDAVDEGRLAFNPAVEVSYLDEADQEIVQEIMDREEISPSLSQAQKLRKLSAEDRIDDDKIEAVMTVEKPMYETITFRRSTVEKYFPAGTTGKEIEQTIIRLLENYSRQRQKQKSKDYER